MGRSAGLAPLRILSTKTAARRNWSKRFGPYDMRAPAVATSPKFEITGGARASFADAAAYGANEEIEPHPQAREDGTEHHGPLGALAAARLSSIAPGMSSQRGPNYAGQNQEDGGQGDAEAHADRLSKLVRLEFRHLSQGRHVAGVHPSRGRVEHFWSSPCG